MATSSLLLDLVNWDFCVDANGNWATCTAPYALAQDAACQARLWKGELRYDTTQGVDYENLVLGHWAPPALVKANIQGQALLATGVERADVFFTSWSNKTRALKGAIVVYPEGTTPPGLPVTVPFTVSAAVAAY